MPRMKGRAWLWLASVLLLLAPWGGPGAGAEQEKGSDLAGTYRNLSFNVDGAGGVQRNMAPLIIFANGQYTWGKEKGRWSAREGKLSLSERPAWGAAAVNKERQLIFEFTRDGKRYTVTMYRAGETPAGGSASSPPEPKN